MRVDLFDFHLPQDLIAQQPVCPRESARLLHVKGDVVADRHVRDLPVLLRPGDLLVVNDTRVLPARLHGRRGQATLEVTLHQIVDDSAWKVFAKPARKARVGDVITFAEEFSADVIAEGETGERTLRFNTSGPDLLAALVAYGQMPLPPYIKRDRTGDPSDLEDYQTLFAREAGAVAAPTASLHFTDRLVDSLRAHDIDLVPITLHVGAGTFLPVKTDDTTEHRMHSEVFTVSEAAAARIAGVRAAGGRIVAIGTTVLRTLEACADARGVVHAQSGATDLFITPGYRFRAIDVLMTNFHLPRSTLFMLVSAWMGLATMQAAYRHAIAARYRFFSYGDACLLEPGGP